MYIEQEHIDELVGMGILKPVEQQIEKDPKEEIYNLYNEYITSRNKKILIKLIELINNNASHQNIREFLDLKVDNETIFDIMVKLKIDFSHLAREYICSQEDLLVKIIKNGGYRILNYAKEEDFFRKIDGITIFEYIIKNNLFEDYWLMRFEGNQSIIDILKKYHKEEYLRNSSESLMFKKYNEEKLIIEYLLEQDFLTPHEVEIIKTHPEIIDYIEKYNRNYLLSYLSDEILYSKKDNKLILEYLLEKGITPTLNVIASDEIVDLLLKYNAYESLSEIGIRHAFKEVPGTNKQLFEFLLTRGIVSYKVISEIYRNTKYAPSIYEILKRNNNLNLISHFDEDRMLLKYGQQESLLESLLKDNQIINARGYKQKESLELLIAYNRYDELAKCSQELLLFVLPNGKKLYEELIYRGIEIQTENVIYQEIAKKIIDEKQVEQLGCLSTEVLLSYADLYETYLDKVLEIIKEENDVNLLYNLKLVNLTQNDRAKIYIIFAKHDFYKHINKLSVESLINEEDGTTLLDELLKEDKETTMKLLLTEDLKSNVNIAAILKLHGIKQKNIEYDILTRNIADEYTNQEIEELNKLPLLPEQEKLLQELFIVMNDGRSEPSRLNSLIASYRFLLSTNNQYAGEIYHLINIKRQNPDFRIEETKRTSHCNYSEQAIRLENLNIATLNHEVGHALHFMIDNLSIPDGFEELIAKHKKSIKTRAMVSLFSKKYGDIYRRISNYVDRIIMKEYDQSITEEDKVKIQEYLDSLKIKQKEQYEEKGYTKQLLDMIFDRTFTVSDYLKQTRRIQRNEMIDRILRTEYPHFIVIGDFFDGIYEGKFRDGKLTDVLGLTYLRSSYGHGINYYKDDLQSVFNEMIANYSEIMKSKNPKEGLEMLRFYLGDELVHMISNYYIQNIYHNYSYLQTQNQTL